MVNPRPPRAMRCLATATATSLCLSDVIGGCKQRLQDPAAAPAALWSAVAGEDFDGFDESRKFVDCSGMVNPCSPVLE